MKNKLDEELSDELLQKAYRELDTKKKITLFKQSLKANPRNIDSMLGLMRMEENPYLRLEQLSEIIAFASLQLEAEGFFTKEYIGSFWGFWETRPYMRARHDKILNLMTVHYYHQAIMESLELLHLNENDNMGIRYLLIRMYAKTLYEEGAKALIETFNDDIFQFNFPYAVLLFRLQKFDEAKKVFDKLFERYPFAPSIIKYNKEPDPETQESMFYGVPIYKPGEVYITLEDNEDLLTPDFMKWFKETYTKKRTPKSTKKVS